MPRSVPSAAEFSLSRIENTRYLPFGFVETLILNIAFPSKRREHKIYTVIYISGTAHPLAASTRVRIYRKIYVKSE